MNCSPSPAEARPPWATDLAASPHNYEGGARTVDAEPAGARARNGAVRAGDCRRTGDAGAPPSGWGVPQPVAEAMSRSRGVPPRGAVCNSERTDVTEVIGASAAALGGAHRALCVVDAAHLLADLHSREDCATTPPHAAAPHRPRPPSVMRGVDLRGGAGQLGRSPRRSSPR
ncbi:hypothetical protein QJS66_08055 [Kocuria rhizophila]|nr:hypothetical protein QJS66_08055 [Kocuria rhizophila]